MSIITHDQVAYFCITHRDPFFNIPHFYNILLTSDYREIYKNYNILSVKEYVDNQKELSPLNNFYPDYFYLFLIQILNELNISIEYICISMYRKIVTREPFGIPSNNFFGMNLSNNNNIPEHYLIFDKKTDYLLCKYLEFKDGIVGQYYRKHCASDFDQFVGMLVPSGTMTSDEVNQFLRLKILIPAVPLGVVPINLFKFLANRITKFIIYSDTNGYKLAEPLHPYQSKARSFFIERISSFLTIQYLMKSSVNGYIDNNFFGTTITFTNQPGELNSYIGGNI